MANVSKKLGPGRMKRVRFIGGPLENSSKGEEWRYLPETYRESEVDGKHVIQHIYRRRAATEDHVPYRYDGTVKEICDTTGE